MRGMEKYVPNRSPVLAVLLDESNLKEAAGWCSGEVIADPEDENAPPLAIFVGAPRAGLTVAKAGDYLIKNNQGIFYVLPPEKFAKRFAKLRTRQFTDKH